MSFCSLSLIHFLKDIIATVTDELFQRLVIIEPLSVDTSKGVINFPFLSEEANIYVPVKNGETLHLLFTPDNVTGLAQ